MYLAIVLLIIGVFLVKFLPPMFGKGKKNGNRKRWSKIIGSIMIVMSILIVVNLIFGLIE